MLLHHHYRTSNAKKYKANLRKTGRSSIYSVENLMKNKTEEKGIKLHNNMILSQRNVLTNFNTANCLLSHTIHLWI